MLSSGRYSHAIVRHLLNSGADPNIRLENKHSWGNSPLHVAVKNSNIDAAKVNNFALFQCFLSFTRNIKVLFSTNGHLEF